MLGQCGSGVVLLASEDRDVSPTIVPESPVGTDRGDGIYRGLVQPSAAPPPQRRNQPGRSPNSPSSPRPRIRGRVRKHINLSQKLDERTLLQKNVLDRRTWVTREQLTHRDRDLDRADLPPTPPTGRPRTFDPDRIRGHHEHDRRTGGVTTTCHLSVQQSQRFFAYVTADLLQRSDHRSVRALENDIRAWVKGWNENPKPFVWTKPAEQILDSLKRLLQRTTGAGHWDAFQS